jgi:ATP-binding cassette subfamily G (WHITE) protein 2
MASLQSNPESMWREGTRNEPYANTERHFGLSFTARVHDEAQPAPEDVREVIASLATSDHDAERFNQSLNMMAATGNVSFHRYVTEDPQSIEQMPVVMLKWRRLSVVAGHTKVLLHGVSGSVSSGMVAVMGPSGSGKSTLLNALFGRLGGAAHVDQGEITFNGMTPDRGTVKRLVGYVMQDDVASPYLTVRETLTLVGSLRYRHVETRAQIERRVADVLDMMSLHHCANNIVGQGLSGGERKRLAIALELLSFPRFLVLDEPTSSLDSLESLQLVQCLRRLTEQHGICVICTIHQPQYKVFSTFERVVLLAKGHTIYDGPVVDVPTFCERRGKPVPRGTNPADTMMDVASAQFEEEMRLSHEPSLTGWQPEGIDPTHLRDVAPRHLQYLTLTRRGFTMATRKRSEIGIAIFQTILNAVLIGTVFLGLSNKASKSQTRMSALFYCCTNQGTFGAISSLNVFSSERILSLRDRNAGIYHALPYYAAKVTVELALRAPYPILFSIIVYWLLGLEADAGKWFFFAFTMWLVNVAAFSLAMSVSVWFRMQEISSLMLPLALEIMRLFGMFFLAPIDAKPGMSWIMRISYLAFGYGAIAWNDLGDRVFDCAAPCAYPATGLAKLQSLGLDRLTQGQYIGGLIAFIVVCQVLTYVGVRVVTW